MLKISWGLAASRLVVRLSGRLAGPWVDELRRVCEAIEPRDQKVSLDFEDVSFVDAEGIQLLHTLAARGMVLTGCTPFIEALIGLADTTEGAP